MKMMKHIQTWLLITLLALSANGVVNAKAVSGYQNLSGDLHQSQTVLNTLLHQGLEQVSTMLTSESPLATKGVGDLTKAELKQLQKVVNEAGRPVEIVGSAAKSTRRNVGSNLPVGKGPGTKSDIDILIPSSSKGNFNGLSNQFPKGSDINVGTANPNIGPSIRIEPNL
jgi:hypothetical protein